ncbi:hypothetical protein [Paenibacillus sp. A3]|uniref:hypothetical protein n=1 Tax=Paenibacillus sp. A3 TaxID=1337054 RepID=UPI0006D53917|nr:hypothetical protein [Paenibacillus sp. A3]
MRSIEPMMDFFLLEKGEPIYIHDVQQLALVRDAADKLQEIDDKMIRTAIPLHTGDLIDYRNERYMIVSQIDKNEQSYRGRMRKCNFKIAFNFQGNVKWLDAIVEGITFSLRPGNIISLPDGTIFVTLQENADTRDIQLNQRFYNTHQPFQVIGIDRTQTGIVKLSCKLDSKSLPYDDVENNIADRWKYHLDATQMEKRKKHLF